MTSKYYAVVSGRKPGIYTDWPTAESMVKGYPGAIFKSFHARSDAEAFMSKSKVSNNGASTINPQTLPLIDRTIIYTDGSSENNIGGFGVIIITTTGDKITAHGRVPLRSTNNVAELYAIYVALSMVKGPVILYSDSRYAISTLNSYASATESTEIANRNIIDPILNLMNERDIVLEHVPAHCGIHYNEEADKLAKQGRTGTSNLVIYKNGILQNGILQ